MNRNLAAIAALAIAFAPTALAKAKKPPQDQQQQQQEENAETGGLPRYQPFPHNIIFNLVDLSGKAPAKDIWLRIDSTGRASGSSGCKSWSGIFVIGPDRLGPRSMPAFTEQQCTPEQLAYEREFWAILLNGPYWDTKGDELIMKQYKGAGVLHFQRSL
ncbi:MAG TPA: META domain-containing protein [Methylocystis sp.]|nr:META domain-containing protein [Methylocystis sp.]